MATYAQIREAVLREHGVKIETCWIADVKRAHGLTTRAAPNRIGAEPKKPCPAHVRPWIEDAMRRFGMIGS